MIAESITLFLVCAAPGFLAGYALCAIRHNRRLARENRPLRLPYDIQRL